MHSFHLYQCDNKSTRLLILRIMQQKVTSNLFHNFRLECFNACNKAYFPRLDCQEIPNLDFYYGNNNYNRGYLFSRPESVKNGVEAVQDYEKCKSYIVENPLFEKANNSTRRQIRTHSCFSFCKNGIDYAFRGDNRPQCVDILPIQRDQIICIYPDDYCESSSVSNEIVISKGFVFSPIIAVFAILCADPLMFLMDFATIYLKKFKPSAESPIANCKLLSFQCFIVIVFIYVVA